MEHPIKRLLLLVCSRMVEFCWIGGNVAYLMFSFSKPIWVFPSWILPKFSVIPPLLGSRLRLTTPFVFLKLKWSPPKNPPPPPPPQAINNDRSLRASDLKLGGSWVQFSAGARNLFITFLVLDFSIWKKKDSARYANKFVSKSLGDSHEPEHC